MDGFALEFAAAIHRYEKPGYAPVVVPVHANKSLKTGMQHAIMKAAGLTEDDL